MSKSIEDVAKNIWEYAEIRFQEVKSAGELADYAKEKGFEVEMGICGLPTAFKATYGSGHPIIAFLGEYDALAGLSQKADIPLKEKGEQENSGHGCGHHLLGAGALYGAEIAKKYLEDNKLEGTIVYYGCPAEEGGSGKTIMAVKGEFKNADLALTWHPFAYNGLFSETTLANYQATFRFEGKSSHAGSSPHLGRSALDAVELMNVGTNYLREHVIQEARFHYAITNTGGVSPNVVQPEAEVLYLIRAPKIAQVDEIFERICNIARGAALMTGTRVKLLFDKGVSEYIGNKEIEKVLYKNMKKLDKIQYTSEELEYAQKFKDTLNNEELASSFGWMEEVAGDSWKSLKEMMISNPIFMGTLPYDSTRTRLLSGSTDVGDVSKNIPTGQIGTACYAIGTAAHSWQMVAQGKSSMALKGMRFAGEVLGQTAIDIFGNKSLFEIIMKNFEETKEEYKSPIKYGKDPIDL
ncbi:amidohydrolase [Fusobacterium sp. PH5-44]|uniref:amidohydrolase n=1 Tax=unclassified Fusobacterium TaxID=2648384 RepID=UPI003D21FEAD